MIGYHTLKDTEHGGGKAVREAKKYAIRSYGCLRSQWKMVSIETERHEWGDC